jgi:hypothetical protein
MFYAELYSFCFTVNTEYSLPISWNWQIHQMGCIIYNTSKLWCDFCNKFHKEKKMIKNDRLIERR